MTNAIDNKEIISGPFGSYNYKSAGGILNALCKAHVPLNRVEDCQLHMETKTVKCWGETLATYKFFEGIYEPLFYFRDNVYGRQNAMFNNAGELHPDFHLSLYTHGSASLVLQKDREKDLFTEDLYDFIKGMMGANISHISEDSPDWMKENNEMYNLRQAAGAFFQGGSASFEYGFLYIEFHKPAGAQAFVDYINNKFVYKGVKAPAPPYDY